MGKPPSGKKALDKRNIVLTGFMGTGKSAVGREIARILGRKIIDIDEEIEKKEKMNISDIFRTRGEDYFRGVETDMIKIFAKSENLVISTGGGAVLREENLNALRENGIVFCLSASPHSIVRRTKGNKDRPLLNVPDPVAKIDELLASRRAFYEKSGVVIDTDNKSPDLVASEILEIVKCAR